MKVVLSGTLQRYTDYRREHSVDAERVGDALRTLADSYPALGVALFDNGGSIRSAHALFLNGEQVAGNLDTPVQNWDELEIITALAGG